MHQRWKIIDFGIASIGDHKTQYSTSDSRGTSGYRAPELVCEVGRYSFATDVWALGCILYELRVRKKIFASDFETRDWAVSEKKLEISLPNNLCILANKEDDKLLIGQMLHRKWVKRPRTVDVEKKIESAYITRCFEGGSGINICT